MTRSRRRAQVELRLAQALGCISPVLKPELHAEPALRLRHPALKPELHQAPAKRNASRARPTEVGGAVQRDKIVE